MPPPNYLPGRKVQSRRVRTKPIGNNGIPQWHDGNNVGQDVIKARAIRESNFYICAPRVAVPTPPAVAEVAADIEAGPIPWSRWGRAEEPSLPRQNQQASWTRFRGVSQLSRTISGISYDARRQWGTP
jgi:hypothetical protein